MVTTEPEVKASEDFFDPAFVEAAAADAREKLGRFNLLVAGNTGVGKSTLVNAVFGVDVADTGTGFPVTPELRYYTNADGSLGLWDIEGFEVGRAKPADRIVEDLRAIAESPREQHVTVAWYCVLADSHRLTDADLEAIRTLNDAGLKVVLVLTKVARRKKTVGTGYEYPEDVREFAAWIEARIDDHSLLVEEVVLTAAKAQGKFGGPPHGLDELVLKTLDLAPRASKDALRVAQRLSLPLKKDLARKAIAAAAATAAAAAAVPIPVADAATLAPIQLGMMGRIASIYGLDVKTMLSPAAVAQLAIQVSGKALAKSFIKLVPGIGSVINATVAAVLTSTAGEGWRKLCEAVYTEKVPLDKIDEAVGQYAPTVAQVLRGLMNARRKP